MARTKAAQPPATENVLSDDLLKALNKHFAHDIQVATASLRDKLEVSEEANNDLVREQSLTQAQLREREAELAVLAEQDAIIRGQVVQMDLDLTHLRQALESERQARLDAERRVAIADAQRKVIGSQLVDLQQHLLMTQNDLSDSRVHAHALSEDVVALRIQSGALQASLDGALQNVVRLEQELLAARQAETLAIQVAAELRGQLKSG